MNQEDEEGFLQPIEFKRKSFTPVQQKLAVNSNHVLGIPVSWYVVSITSSEQPVNNLVLINLVCESNACNCWSYNRLDSGAQVMSFA
jgi:hypothetical protein